MTDELIEKVAKAICCDSKCEAPRVCDCSIGIFRDSARAAIAVVVEECARVAETCQTRNKTVWKDGQIEIVRADISAAIRALGAAK